MASLLCFSPVLFSCDTRLLALTANLTGNAFLDTLPEVVIFSFITGVVCCTELMLLG